LILFFSLKPLTTFLILLSSLIYKTSNLEKYAKLISAGLIFYLIGDLFLYRESLFDQFLF
jgi:uncharacterized membrane protein YhhN